MRGGIGKGPGRQDISTGFADQEEIMQYQVCGITDMPDGTLKVYLNSRPEGWFIIVESPEDIEATKRMWSRSSMGHCFVNAEQIPEESIQIETVSE